MGVLYYLLPFTNVNHFWQHYHTSYYVGGWSTDAATATHVGWSSHEYHFNDNDRITITHIIHSFSLLQHLPHSHRILAGVLLHSFTSSILAHLLIDVSILMSHCTNPQPLLIIFILVIVIRVVRGIVRLHLCQRWTDVAGGGGSN